MRTFVAVDVDDVVRGRAGALVDRLARVTTDVRWVEPENMHFTLKFLGDVPVGDSVAVCRAVADAVADCEPFDLAVAGVGAFPSIDRPRTIWIGASDGSEAFAAVYDRVEAALVALGYPSEPRGFVPHLTIGRLRRRSHREDHLVDALAEHAADEFGRTAVEEVTVYSSRLTPEGPIYDALSRAPIGG